MAVFSPEMALCIGAIADGEDPGRPDVSIAKGGAMGLRPLSATDRGH